MQTDKKQSMFYSLLPTYTKNMPFITKSQNDLLRLLIKKCFSLALDDLIKDSSLVEDTKHYTPTGLIETYVKITAQATITAKTIQLPILSDKNFDKGDFSKCTSDEKEQLQQLGIKSGNLSRITKKALAYTDGDLKKTDSNNVVKALDRTNLLQRIIISALTTNFPQRAINIICAQDIMSKSRCHEKYQESHLSFFSGLVRKINQSHVLTLFFTNYVLSSRRKDVLQNLRNEIESELSNNLSYVCKHVILNCETIKAATKEPKYVRYDYPHLHPPAQKLETLLKINNLRLYIKVTNSHKMMLITEITDTTPTVTLNMMCMPARAATTVAQDEAIETAKKYILVALTINELQEIIAKLLESFPKDKSIHMHKKLSSYLSKLTEASLSVSEHATSSESKLLLHGPY